MRGDGRDLSPDCARERLANDLRVGLDLRLGAEMHEIAATAGPYLGAGRLDPIGRGLEQPEHSSSRRLFREKDLRRDEVAFRGAGQKDSPAALIRF